MPARPRAPHGQVRLRRTRVAVGFLVSWGLLGALVGTFWLTTGGEHGKIRVMTVLTGSMRPTLGVGDLVIAEVVPASQIEAGDIVTYREPSGDRFVTHRVQSIVWTGQLGNVVTRGDANEVGETWTVEADGALGRVKVHLPLVGYAVGALSTMAGRLTITGLALALGAYALLLIWRPRREDITARIMEELLLLDAVEAPCDDDAVARVPAPWVSADDDAGDPARTDAPREEVLAGAR